MSSFSFSNLKAGVDTRGLPHLWDFQDVVFADTEVCFLAGTCMAVAKLSENKTFLVKCESASSVKKFRNTTILSISVLQGSYSSATESRSIDFFFLS